MAWNPSKYLKFLSPRLKPALHLLEESSSLLLNSPSQQSNVTKVLDLGCGPGNITKYLCDKFPIAHIDGIDTSQDMISRAQLDNIGKNVSFRCSSIEEECLQVSRKYDLVYSNAALHWCLDHQTLLPRIISNLVSSQGGVFSFQIPDTLNQPSHVLMDIAATKCGFTEQLKHIRIPRMDHPINWYYNLLRPHVHTLEMWTTEYTNPLEITSEEWHPVLQFTESTGLKPLVDELGGPASVQGKEFLHTYNSLLHHAYPIEGSGSERTALFTFRRFFVVCQK